MGRKRVITAALFAIAITVLAGSGCGWAQKTVMTFPSYGSGAVEVRLYASYHCPPCRAMEPALEPIIKDLLTKNTIHLTFIDVPSGRLTPLFVKSFLYALHQKNDIDHALHVRAILFEAAAQKDVSTQERIEAIFREKGISYSVFDHKYAFDRFNLLLQEDRIKATPTCVIIKKNEKKDYVGAQEILKALKSLQ